jgi:hypothetical protein
MLQFDHQNCELDPDKVISSIFKYLHETYIYMKPMFSFQSTNSDHCGCCRGFNTSCDADYLNYQVLLLLLGAMQFVFAHQ